MVATWKRLVVRGRPTVQVTPFEDVPAGVLADHERAAAALTFRGEG